MQITDREAYVIARSLKKGVDQGYNDVNFNINTDNTSMVGLKRRGKKSFVYIQKDGKMDRTVRFPAIKVPVDVDILSDTVEQAVNGSVFLADQELNTSKAAFKNDKAFQEEAEAASENIEDEETVKETIEDEVVDEDPVAEEPLAEPADFIEDLISKTSEPVVEPIAEVNENDPDEVIENVPDNTMEVPVETESKDADDTEPVKEVIGEVPKPVIEVAPVIRTHSPLATQISERPDDFAQSISGIFREIAGCDIDVAENLFVKAAMIAISLTGDTIDDLANAVDADSRDIIMADYEDKLHRKNK